MITGTLGYSIPKRHEISSKLKLDDGISLLRKQTYLHKTLIYNTLISGMILLNRQIGYEVIKNLYDLIHKNKPMKTQQPNEFDLQLTPVFDIQPESEGPAFLQDVLKGLTASSKYLNSKYFYDATGDKLFQRIMGMDEYYPFQCEMEIFTTLTAEIADIITTQGKNFDLIELGAGDGTKSIHLLKLLSAMNADYTYMPIDISANVIEHLVQNLPVIIPGVKVTGLNGGYFEMLKMAKDISKRRKVIMFLGSNLGNMPLREAMEFCRRMRTLLRPGDLIIAGIDLKKNPATILAAYNDRSGITKAFNLNLLSRINRELDANFNLTEFEHYPTYDPKTGSCISYLMSKKDQNITVNGKNIYFTKDEYIEMEISQKYSIEDIESLAASASFRTNEMFFDSRKWFVDVIWTVV